MSNPAAVTFTWMLVNRPKVIDDAIEAIPRARAGVPGGSSGRSAGGACHASAEALLAPDHGVTHAARATNSRSRSNRSRKVGLGWRVRDTGVTLSVCVHIARRT